MKNNFTDGTLLSKNRIRTKDFRSAQNRVAIMMFLMMFMEFTASAVMILLVTVFPQLKADLFKYELMQALFYIAYLAIPVFTFGLISGIRPDRYFALGRGGKHTVAAGFATMGIVYFAQLAATVISKIAGSAGINTESGALAATSDPAVIVLRFIYLAALPAVLEELMTRGLVLGELLPYGKGFAVIASGALFGLMHMNPIQLPFAFIAGTAMAYAVLYTKTLRVAITVHFVNNFLSVLMSTLPQFMPKDTVSYIEAAVSFVIFAAGTFAAIRLIGRKDDDKERTGGALCTECGEPYKADLRDGVLKSISPLLYIYAAAAAGVTVFSLVMSIVR